MDKKAKHAGGQEHWKVGVISNHWQSSDMPEPESLRLMECPMMMTTGYINLDDTVGSIRFI